MSEITIKISVRGKWIQVPALTIQDRNVVVTGRALHRATIQDSEWVEGNVVPEPELFIEKLRACAQCPDIFTFPQPITESEPKYNYPFEWDDVAAVPISTFNAWWDPLPQASRKNVRRAERRGVTVRLTPFDDALVAGIARIYNETPIRQGRRFWHFGKSIEEVRRDNASYLERSHFIGAYFQGELIGFIKMVYVGRVARIMQILSMNQHFDKRPTNALIANAIEVCCEQGASHFVYGRFIYDNKENSPITEFKRRNGFERMRFPVYYVPLTRKGRLALAAKVHRGYKKLIPENIMTRLLNWRARVYAWRGLAEVKAVDSVSSKKSVLEKIPA